MSPREGISGSFSKKMAITARLMVKEIYRNKLRWFDLRRADYRLGRRAYESQSSLSAQSRIVNRLAQLQLRIEVLGQSVDSGPSFKEKLIGAVKGVGRAMKIQLLKFRRNRLLTKLGRRIAEEQAADNSLGAETGEVKAASDKLRLVDAEIKTLAAQSYIWARRPLLTGSIAVAAAIVCTGTFYHQALAAPDLSTPKKAVQAFEDALQHNDMALARSLVLGTDEQLAAMKAAYDYVDGLCRVLATASKKFGANETDIKTAADCDKIWTTGEEHIDGDKATVKADLGLGSSDQKLEKSGEIWRLDLREAKPPAASELAAMQHVANGLKEITENIKKGHYKTKEDVDNDIRVRLAAAFSETAKVNAAAAGTPQPSPSAAANQSGNPAVFAGFLAAAAALEATTPVAQSSGNSTRPTSTSRTETSLAVERYVRSRLIGGVTENQIVQLSDAIAEKFDAADLPAKERGYCISGTGDQRKILLCMLDQLATGELSPADTKVAAKRLMKEIHDMIPPRAVPNSLFGWGGQTNDKALPAVEAPIRPGSQSAGSLASEHLETFEEAIYYLASDHDPKQSPLAYWKQVKQFESVYVLACEYRGETPGSRTRPYYFWYRHVPDGVKEALASLPAEHPIRQIGPPQESGPVELAMAKDINSGAVEAEKRAVTWEKAHHVEPSLKLTGRDIVLGAAGLLLGTALHADIERRNLIKQRIAESGGTKIECPICHGSGLEKNFNYSNQNPYPYGSLKAQDFDHNNPMYFQCPKCKGYGVIDK